MRTPRRRTRFAIAATLLLATGPAHAAVHMMFITSATGTGKLSTWPEASGNSGLAAGDAICQTLAAAAGLANSGNFVAWLSTGTTDAYCRVAGFTGKLSDNCGQATLPDAGPWMRTDGRPFSRHLPVLTDPFNSQILYPPYVDQNGTTVPKASVHTGTHWSGELFSQGATPATCSGWTGQAAAGLDRTGDNSAGYAWWTSNFTQGCDTVGHLYCFEKGPGSSLPSFDGPGAYVFVTSATGQGDLGSWPDAGGATGLAAGDAICQNLATAAALPRPESFVAYLSTSSVDAIDRLTTDGPFRRPGGVEIAANKADLLWTLQTEIALLSDIEVDEQGQHGLGGVFTGTDNQGHWSGNSCADWMDGTAGSLFDYGARNLASGSWSFVFNSETCDAIAGFYCFSNVVTIFVDGFEGGGLGAWSSSVP